MLRHDRTGEPCLGQAGLFRLHNWTMSTMPPLAPQLSTAVDGLPLKANSLDVWPRSAARPHRESTGVQDGRTGLSHCYAISPWGYGETPCLHHSRGGTRTPDPVINSKHSRVVAQQLTSPCYPGVIPGHRATYSSRSLCRDSPNGLSSGSGSVNVPPPASSANRTALR
jgi:hypothetical protein